MSKHKTGKKGIQRSQLKGAMSSGTKDLIQKFCYKKTASVDMTKNGFIYDNKIFALSLLLRRLREKCEKIWDKKTPRTLYVKKADQKRVTTFKKEVKINII